MRTNMFALDFVEYIPVQLADGVLYVSIPYCTAVHRCACGCGNKVVTPISPSDWKILYDGEALSLFPSVGNWGFPCKAHYWIRANQVLWAKAWTPQQIADGRARESRERAEYFAQRSGLSESPDPPQSTTTVRRRRSAWISRVVMRKRRGFRRRSDTGG